MIPTLPIWREATVSMANACKAEVKGSVEHLQRGDDPMIVMVCFQMWLDQVIASCQLPNDQAHPTAAESDGGAGGKESNGK